MWLAGALQVDLTPKHDWRRLDINISNMAGGEVAATHWNKYRPTRPNMSAYNFQCSSRHELLIRCNCAHVAFAKLKQATQTNNYIRISGRRPPCKLLCYWFISRSGNRNRNNLRTWQCWLFRLKKSVLLWTKDGASALSADRHERFPLSIKPIVESIFAFNFWS
jgi:hypothetical protein